MTNNQFRAFQLLKLTLLLLGVQTCCGQAKKDRGCHDFGDVMRCFSAHGVAYNIKKALQVCNSNSKKLLQLESLDHPDAAGFLRSRFEHSVFIGAWVAPDSITQQEDGTPQTSTPKPQFGRHDCSVLTFYDLKRLVPCSHHVIFYNVLCYSETLLATTTSPESAASKGSPTYSSFIGIITSLIVVIVVIPLIVIIAVCVRRHRRDKTSQRNNQNIMIMQQMVVSNDNANGQENRPRNSRNQSTQASQPRDESSSHANGERDKPPKYGDLKLPKDYLPPAYDEALQQIGSHGASGYTNNGYVGDEEKGQKPSSRRNEKN